MAGLKVFAIVFMTGLGLRLSAVIHAQWVEGLIQVTKRDYLKVVGDDFEQSRSAEIARGSARLLAKQGVLLMLISPLAGLITFVVSR